MLEEYLNSLEPWLKQLFPPEQVDAYLSIMIKNVLKSSNVLEPSADFSVAAAVMGTDVLLERHLPETLEDAFTLIHQNWIGGVQRLFSLLLSQGFIASLELPSVYDWMIQQKGLYLQQYTYEYEGKLTGLEVHPSRIDFHYNIELRHHSAAVSWSIDTNTNDCIAKISLYGEQRRPGQLRRWDRSLTYLKFLDALNIVTIHGTPSVHAKQLIVEVKASSYETMPDPRRIRPNFDGQIQYIRKSFIELIEFSMALHDDYRINFYEEHLSRLVGSIGTEGKWKEGQFIREVSENRLKVVHDLLVTLVLQNASDQQFLTFYLDFLLLEIKSKVFSGSKINDPITAKVIAAAIKKLANEIEPKSPETMNMLIEFRSSPLVYQLLYQ